MARSTTTVPALPIDRESEVTAALTRALRDCPPTLGARSVEVRRFAPGGAGSVLHLRLGADPRDSDPRESIVDDRQLRQALTRPNPTVLEDLLGGEAPDAVRSWLLIPLCSCDDGSELRALIGCSAPPVTINAIDLHAVCERVQTLVSTSDLDGGPRPVAAQPPLADAIAEAVPVPMVVVTADGTIRSANRNFRFLFQCDGLTDPKLRTVLPPDYASVFETALRATLHRNSSVELPLPPLQGALHGLTYTLATSLYEDANDSFVIFALREVSAGLQLSQLRESNEMKEFLFRTLLHDMKTPLAAIINGVELLRSMMPDNGDDGCGELLWAIDSSGNRIKMLLDDMNEYFLLRFREDGEIFRIVDLNEVIDPLLKVYRMQGLPHSFTVHVTGDGLVTGDKNRINRAIDNILSNAVKYAPGGEVAIRVAPDTDSFVRVEISDEGPGIPESFLDKIWDPFYRLRTADNDNIEGSGLGLSITRHIVEGQGGTINAHSLAGQGTTFVIRLQQAMTHSH